MSSFLYKKIWHGISIHTRKCIPPIVACGGSQRLASRRKTKSQVTSVSLPLVLFIFMLQSRIKFDIIFIVLNSNDYD